MSFSPVRLDGGGCCNVQALNPAGTKLIAGADTQGFYLSTTSPLGNKWSVQNKGIGKSNFYRQCAALWWSSTETSPQVIYAGTGERGSGGGLLAGTIGSDGNISWALRSGTPQFSGNTVTAPLPSDGWKRSTGRLLYQDSLYLFAGTYKQGILRSSNTGGSGIPGSDNFPTACTMAGAAPGTGNWFCRAAVPDVNTATTLWAGFYDSTGTGAGLWTSTNAHAGTPNFTQVAGGPTACEDIKSLGFYIYVAAANQGCWRYGPTNGSPAWSNISSSFMDTASSNWWNTIDGYTDGSGNHVLVVGDSNPSTLSKTLVQLSGAPGAGTGSITYTALTGSVQVTTVPTATGSYTWWLPAAGLHEFLGGGGFINPQVNADASNLAAVKLYCAGSGGAYRNVGSGWTVANSGMPMFLAHPVAADPVHAGHVIWGDSDWCLFDDTAPGAETAATLINDPPVNSTMGQAVAFSPDGLTVYGSQGEKYTNANGEVWSRPQGQPANWTAMGLKGPAGGKVALGLAAFDDAGGTRIVLAAVWGSGLWRWDGTSWTRRNATIGASGSAGNQIPVTYYGGGLAFTYDRKTGIWRSSDYGVTWTLIWAKTTNDSLSGTVAYDVTRPGRLWVSAAGQLYKLSGADTGTVAGGGITGAGSPVTPAGTQAGPVACAAGNLYYATQDTGSGSGLLQTGDDGATFADISGGDGSFARCNCNPEFISAGPPEAAQGNQPRLYISGSNVVAQGYASSSPPPPPGSLAFTEVQTSGNISGVAGVLGLWFSETTSGPPAAGGAGIASQVGSLLVARIETSDGTATITPPPGWQLAYDIAAANTTGTTRLLQYHYCNNPGGLGGPAAQNAALQVPPALRRPAHLTAAPAILPGPAAQSAAYGPPRAGSAIIGGALEAPSGGGLIIFTSTSTAVIKGKVTEYSTPAGSQQIADQAGTNSATSGATSFPVTASAANTYTGGLATAFFGANFSSAPSGQSWTQPGGWTGDGLITNNVTLAFDMVYETGITAGPTTVTGQYSTSVNMTSWAAGVATYYAIPAGPVSITTTSCPDGTVSAAYSRTLAASGGVPSYTWALASGTLPTGLSISSGGLISGTPTVAGTYTFTVQVTDQASQVATRAYTVTIAAALTVTTTSPLPAGTAGAPYTDTLAASGGTP